MRLRQIDVEEDVIDMAGIGKQIEKVELYVVHEFHIRSIDPSLYHSTVESETKKESEDLWNVDITFDDFIGNEELPVHVPVQELNNGKRRGPETEEEDGADAKNEAESESGDDGEGFHDSDYDFSKDKDYIIFKNCTATVDNAIDGQIVIDNVGVGEKIAIPNDE